MYLFAKQCQSTSLFMKCNEFWVTPCFPPGRNIDLKSLLHFQLTTRPGQKIEGIYPWTRISHSEKVAKIFKWAQYQNLSFRRFLCEYSWVVHSCPSKKGKNGSFWETPKKSLILNQIFLILRLCLPQTIWKLGRGNRLLFSELALSSQMA